MTTWCSHPNSGAVTQQKGEEVEVNPSSVLRSQRDGAWNTLPEIILKGTCQKRGHQSRTQTPGSGGGQQIQGPCWCPWGSRQLSSTNAQDLGRCFDWRQPHGLGLLGDWESWDWTSELPPQQRSPCFTQQPGEPQGTHVGWVAQSFSQIPGLRAWLNSKPHKQRWGGSWGSFLLEELVYKLPAPIRLLEGLSPAVEMVLRQLHTFQQQTLHTPLWSGGLELPESCAPLLPPCWFTSLSTPCLFLLLLFLLPRSGQFRLCLAEPLCFAPGDPAHLNLSTELLAAASLLDTARPTCKTQTGTG